MLYKLISIYCISILLNINAANVKYMYKFESSIYCTTYISNNIQLLDVFLDCKESISNIDSQGFNKYSSTILSSNQENSLSGKIHDIFEIQLDKTSFWRFIVRLLLSLFGFHIIFMLLSFLRLLPISVFSPNLAIAHYNNQINLRGIITFFKIITQLSLYFLWGTYLATCVKIYSMDNSIFTMVFYTLIAVGVMISPTKYFSHYGARSFVNEDVNLKYQRTLVSTSSLSILSFIIFIFFPSLLPKIGPINSIIDFLT